MSPGVRLLDHVATVFLVFKETFILFSLWLHQFTFPPTVLEGFLFSTPSPTFVICGLFNNGHSDWCEVVPHCFDYISLIISIVEHLFQLPIGHLYVVFGEMLT